MKPFITYMFILLALWTGLSGFFVDFSKKNTVGKSGLPLPRFVSLAHNTVNVRSGPDEKYPIVWVFKKKNLPVKIIAEYRDWRKIIDSDGEKGWIWAPLLSSKRMGLILRSHQPLFRDPNAPKSISVIAKAGVIGQIRQCRKTWCELTINGFKGWLKQADFWGTLHQEIID